MSDNQFTFGRLPMRRIVVGVFVGAALIAGVAGAASSGPTAAESAADTPDYSVVERRGALVVIRDGDGDQWGCHYDGADLFDFTPSESACSPFAGALGGPVEPLGYPSAELAARECAGGEVITLKRQYQVVGYSCLLGGGQ